MKLHEDTSAFAELITATAEHISLPEIYVEKDYWVTRALKYLSESEHSQNAVFKGGTSLSKAYRLIDRFSEDIDLAIFATDLSGNQIKRLLKNIEIAASQGLTEIEDDSRISKSSSFHKTVYQYPRLIENDEFGQASPDLVIEVNSFTNPEPFEELELQTFIADMLIDIDKSELINEYGLESIAVQVLSVKRTLIEKILGVIKDSYNPEPTVRLSLRIRHLYDICLILQQEEHRNFVTSDEFSALCKACIEDERILFKDTADLFDNALADAPIFSNFNEWRTSLESTYSSSFSELVYSDLPAMQEIEDSLTFIKEHLSDKNL